MIRKMVLPLLAVAGIVFSIFMIFWSARRPPEHTIIFAPPVAPYKHYVAGEGIIEALGKNTDMGVAFPDLIWEQFVQVGQQVKKGDPLFKVDTRQQEADLLEATAKFKLAHTNYENAKQQFDFYDRLTCKNAVSEKAYTEAYYEKQRSEDEIKVALAMIRRLKTRIERSYVIAPKDGVVLQENIRVGEFANVNPFDNEKLLVLGDTNVMQLSVNIAEEDAWRVIPNAPGIAYVRGNSSIQIPLTFQYIEPLMVPKRTLTGSDLERVDTRVLQIIYTFEKHSYPVYVGQLLDVYLQARPSIGA